MINGLFLGQLLFSALHQKFVTVGTLLVVYAYRKL